MVSVNRPAPTLSSPSGWQFRVTPYAWAPSVNGDVTVRGRTVDIDMSFWDLFDFPAIPRWSWTPFLR